MHRISIHISPDNSPPNEPTFEGGGGEGWRGMMPAGGLCSGMPDGTNMITDQYETYRSRTLIQRRRYDRVTCRTSKTIDAGSIEAAWLEGGGGF
ncbi:hypothetical protein J6590_020849 [Homalodisca vitripennis]|nr:hypothetical protein J6590_020849 [Homalodisca vitripennis]